jgi:predicted dehydrogenase
VIHTHNRRQFLADAAAATIAASVLRAGPAVAAQRPAGDKLNLAIVGCGGRGRDNLEGVAGENIVALCDVDERQAAKAFEIHPKARRFRDYRRLFDAMHGQIDAVVVSTPDHMHAPISLLAMTLGKHVYCEKPLTWGIDEARKMASIAREKHLATQMGTQGMAQDRSRAGVEIIRSGVLGEITELHVWTDRATGWWDQGVERPRENQPVPAGLDWDLWLGVAPKRPYHRAYCPFAWRGWKDFGTGAVGDMGIHNAAMPFAALELGPPSAAEIIETSGLKSETFPSWSRLKLEFPAKNGRVPLTLFWYDGGKRPRAELAGKNVRLKNLEKNGAIVVGTKGTLYSAEWTGGDWALLPKEKFRDFKAPERSQPRAPQENHHQEWLRACRGGPPAYCRFDGFAAQLTEAMLVANLALRTGKKIHWDAEAMQARNCSEAAPAVRREYRSGW